MQTDSSAICAWREVLSAVEYTATQRMLSSLHALIIRTAISPLLAISTFLNIYDYPPYGLFVVCDNKGYLAGYSLFATYGRKRLSCTNRSALTYHLHFKVKDVAGNHLSAELSLVDASEKSDLALELGL